MKPNKDLAVNGVDSGEGLSRLEMDEDKEIDGEGIEQLTNVNQSSFQFSSCTFNCLSR